MNIVRYRASIERLEGYTMEGKSRKHTVTVDEPYGADTAMNPIELMLNALGACKIAVALDNAEKRGITIDEIKVDLVGTRHRKDPDNPEEEVYTGLVALETTYHIESDASEAELQELVDHVDATCPVGVTMKNGVEIESKLKVKK